MLSTPQEYWFSFCDETRNLYWLHFPGNSDALLAWNYQPAVLTPSSGMALKTLHNLSLLYLPREFFLFVYLFIFFVMAMPPSHLSTHKKPVLHAHFCFPLLSYMLFTLSFLWDTSNHGSSYWGITQFLLAEKSFLIFWARLSCFLLYTPRQHTLFKPRW